MLTPCCLELSEGRRAWFKFPLWTMHRDKGSGVSVAFQKSGYTSQAPAREADQRHAHWLCRPAPYLKQSSTPKPAFSLESKLQTCASSFPKWPLSLALHLKLFYLLRDEVSSEAPLAYYMARPRDRLPSPTPPRAPPQCFPASPYPPALPS